MNVWLIPCLVHLNQRLQTLACSVRNLPRFGVASRDGFPSLRVAQIPPWPLPRCHGGLAGPAGSVRSVGQGEGRGRPVRQPPGRGRIGLTTSASLCQGGGSAAAAAGSAGLRPAGSAAAAPGQGNHHQRQSQASATDRRGHQLRGGAGSGWPGRPKPNGCGTVHNPRPIPGRPVPQPPSVSGRPTTGGLVLLMGWASAVAAA